MEREHGIVRLDDGVGDLRGRDHREGRHDAVRVLLAHLRDEQRAHARTRAAPQGVAHLEALEAVAALGLFAHNVQDGVDELGSLRVVALGPVVARARLAEHKVVWPEKLAEGPRSDAVHGARLKVHEDGAWDVAAARGLVVVNVNPLQLQVRVAMVCASGIDAVLVRNDLPELGTDLVAALAGLDVDKLAHCGLFPVRLWAASLYGRSA
mmetsp:Transcript_76572/g.173156  ORF Transcript_76572/g.173156 Transcript_76572/m.173156 type:complete len:209 (-) Transcript_76572:26-652(-)